MSSIVVDEGSVARDELLRRARPGRQALIVAAGLVLAAAVAFPFAVRQSGHPSGDGSTTGEAAFNWVSFHPPVGWHTVQPTFLTGAMAYPLGWITNAQPGPQCTAGRTGRISCHGPVTNFGSGIVQIALVAAGGSVYFTRGLQFNARFAGLPARRVAGTEGCDPSAVSGFSIIAAETQSVGVRLIACFGPNSATQQIQVRQLLDTANYQHP
jgi:hypothetical protein